MSDDGTEQRVAQVLAAHEGKDWSDQGVRCHCGWIGDDHAAHQARALGAAELLKEKDA